MFWLTFDTPRDIEVFIVEAGFLAMARVKAVMAGQEGTFKEGHQLDAKAAKIIPKDLMGKTLSRKEAERLLMRLV